MINRIEEWIVGINKRYRPHRISCSLFESEFAGFYPSKFLRDSYFVAVNDIPKPNFPELREIGLGDFIEMPVNGITYKNTYYINKSQARNLRLHFHELVHVVQWDMLGTAGFIGRYINEIQIHGYDSAPLELMAYNLDNHYSTGGPPLDIPSHVQSKI